MRRRVVLALAALTLWVAGTVAGSIGPAAPTPAAALPMLVIGKAHAGYTPQLAGDKPIFILALGSDARPGTPIDHGLSDSIHIIAINPDKERVSILGFPRDSYVPIPGHGRNKLNAAYAFGGAPLLARTVETVTGLRIDHYAEVGFGGFVGMTDAVGGVQLCPTRNINDHKSGLHVKKGCQEMDGATALAYVRARYFDPQGDLGRVKRQQEFLGAVFDEAVSPTTLLNPFRVLSLGNAATTALTIDNGDGPVSLLQFARTMRAVAGGDGKRVTVPVSDVNYSTSAGSAVKWDTQRALALFHSLRAN